MKDVEWKRVIRPGEAEQAAMWGLDLNVSSDDQVWADISARRLPLPDTEAERDEIVRQSRDMWDRAFKRIQAEWPAL